MLPSPFYPYFLCLFTPQTYLNGLRECVLPTKNWECRHHGSSKSSRRARGVPLLRSNLDAGEAFIQFECPADGRLKHTLRKYMGVQMSEIESLICLGAVHVRKMKHQQFLLPFTRRLEDSSVRKGSIIRVYSNPRHFPTCYVAWNERILFEDEHFVVVNKPPWLPFQPTNDNFKECLLNCVRDGLKAAGSSVTKLYGIHRLDMCTTGAIALAKTKSAANEFHKLLREADTADNLGSLIEKTYVTLSSKPLPLGKLTHWLCPSSVNAKLLCLKGQNVVPQLMTTNPHDGFKCCTLEVVSCIPIKLESCGSKQSNDGIFYESKVVLHSGRKHQIRAQAAAVGAPLIGDTLYGPLSGLTLDVNFPALFECAYTALIAQKCELSGLNEDANEQLSRLNALLMDLRPPEPTDDLGGSVGLHATCLHFLGRRVCAPPAWWQAPADQLNPDIA